MNIEIYSKTTCPVCQLAKDYLAEHGMGYFEHLYDDDDERRASDQRSGAAALQDGAADDRYQRKYDADDA